MGWVGLGQDFQETLCIELDWIVYLGGMTVTPRLNYSTVSSTVDAVSYKLWFMIFLIIPIYND